MLRSVKFGLPAVILAALAGCAPDYSPNTYAGTAVQQANKVESAVVVGFRQVEISANGSVGAVTGGAAGGILGLQSDAIGLNGGLGAVAGSAIGGFVGSTIAHATGDTTGWEYIVRKPNGDLISVTQREPTPIPLGQKVLVITGSQARIVPDYSVAIEQPAAPAAPKATEVKAKAEVRALPAAPTPAVTGAPAATVTPTPEATPATPPPSPLDKPPAVVVIEVPPMPVAAPSTPASPAVEPVPVAAPPTPASPSVEPVPAAAPTIPTAEAAPAGPMAQQTDRPAAAAIEAPAAMTVDPVATAPSIPPKSATGTAEPELPSK